MWEDEIVNEIRKYRNEYAAMHYYDTEAIYRDLKNKENKSEHKKFSFQPKKFLNLLARRTDTA